MSEAYNILYSFKSLQDLEEIYAYIAYKLFAPQIAEKQVHRIRTIIRKLDFYAGKICVGGR